MAPQKYFQKMQCPYNENVFCTIYEKNCPACGWNPDVAIARLVKICKQMGVNLPDCMKDRTNT